MKLRPELQESRTWVFDYLLSILAGVVVIIAIPIVGVLLISALLVLPALISTQVTKSFKQTVILAPIIGLITVIFGILASVILDAAPGGTIVLSGLSDSCNSFHWKENPRFYDKTKTKVNDSFFKSVPHARFLVIKKKHVLEIEFALIAIFIESSKLQIRILSALPLNGVSLYRTQPRKGRSPPNLLVFIERSHGRLPIYFIITDSRHDELSTFSNTESSEF